MLLKFEIEIRSLNVPITHI